MKKYKEYIYLIAVLVFGIWLGFFGGVAVENSHSIKRSEKYKVEMLKDSLYFEYSKSLNN